MFRASFKLFLGMALAAIALALVPSAASAAGSLSADYRFEGDFRSSAGSAKKLVPEGPVRMCPPCEELTKTKVNGRKQGVWSWPQGDGLRLDGADKLLGHGGKTYTVAMLVKLDTVSDYRKLIDFEDRDQDEGWYVYEESLYPYDLADFDYSKQVIQADKWRQIVLTRDGQGVARGYVDGKALGKDKDPDRHVSLHGNKLHFLIDNEGGVEQSGGMIARLRIWETALSNEKIKGLGD